MSDFVYEYLPGISNRTLLLLHGTGGDERSLLWLGEALDSDANRLSPRGKISEDGKNRFFRRISEGVFDLQDLVFRTNELAEFLRELNAGHLPPPIAVGFSNGANIAASLLLLEPGALSGAVLFRPMVPIVPESRPDLSGVPVFIAAGRADPIVSADQSEAIASLLAGCGADVDLHWTDTGHSLHREEIRAAANWLHSL